MNANPSPSVLPPRMRKLWPQPPTAQPEPMQENPRDHSTRAESRRAHERWRSPSDVNAESPISVSGSVERSGKGGATKPGSLSGDGEDGQDTEFDTETEADGSDGRCLLPISALWPSFILFSIDTRQMPPPPMPASLDPTTVSSLAHAQTVRSSSPRDSIQWDKNGVAAAWIPPRTPTPTSASSGRSSQPHSQGMATPVPPARSSAPSQVSYGALPLSTSFPLAMQAQVQLHPPPLAPSVSPSATFSKLSLHSPDTSSSPHLSVLFSPSESTSLSAASASTERTSDLQPPSPPPHRPSKPLHVHPQNEPPSLSASLSAPVVTLNSPDGMRDTPAEAQYQQPYRSSPESRHETHSPPDVDKKRLTNGETYRVRFVSPETLCRLPRLRGRATPNSLEPVDGDDGVSANPKLPEVLNEQEDFLLAYDAMDVDVVGDNKREGGSAPSHAEGPESKTNHDPDGEYSSLQVPSSPQPQAPSETQPHSIDAVADGAAPENDSSSPASDVNERTPQAESMPVDPDPAQSRELSPPPLPKVKMSLKDFALRKKKQREEEMAAKALRSPAAPDGPGLPSSPDLDVQRDLTNEHADPGSIDNGHEVKMNGTTEEDAVESSWTPHVSANVFDDGSGNVYDGAQDFGRTEEKAAAEDNKSSADTQVPSVIAATKLPDTTQSSPRLSRSPTTSPRVLGDKNNTGQTQMQIDSKPPTTLTAKMEVIDAMLPSGPVGADDRMPDVVSFAPEPPPPPLTTKQTSETTTVDRTMPTSSIPRSIAPSTPASTSTPVSMSTSTSAANSRSNSVGIPVSILNPNLPPHPHLPTSSSNIPPSRRPSHEDGEITSSTPPKTYLPRSHTPPTQPRSFHTVHPPSPSFGPTSSSTMPVPRRPAPPLSRSSLSNAAGPTTISSRPLPSGPRALRGSTTQPTHAPPYPSTRPPYAGSQYIPRGPSADRDRIDWDRGDRQWAAQARSRGRAGSNGWGR